MGTRLNKLRAKTCAGVLMSQASIPFIPMPRFRKTNTMNEQNRKDVVLYDGQCNFCRSQINILRRLDGRNRFEFVSLHDPQVATSYPSLTFEQLMEQMWIVTPEGAQHGGAYAVRYLSRRLPILWPLAPLMHTPFTMPLWRFLYRQVAKYRYKLAGRDCDEGGTCTLHR